MSSRKDVMKKHFTTEQLNWLFRTYPDYQPPESDAQAVRDAARLLMAGRQFAGEDKEKKTENMAKLAKLVLGKDTFSLGDAAAKVGFTGKDAEAEFRDAYYGNNPEKTPKADNTTLAAWYATLNDAYGDNGWNLVKKELQKSEIENMEKAILEGRAKAVEEGSSGVFGFLNRTLNPTAYKEAVFQSLNDVPMDKSRVRNAAIADFGANALEASAVGLNPMVAIPAIMGVETGRQMLANQVFGHKTTPEEVASMAIGAGLAGGTTPAAMTGLGTIFSKVPGMRDFGRGLVKGARGYQTDYAQQLDDLTKSVLELRKLKSQDASKMGAAQLDHMQNLEDDVVRKLQTIGVNTDNSLLGKASLNVLSNTLAKNPSKFTIADLIGTGEKITDKQVKKELRDVYKQKRDWTYAPEAEDFARQRDWMASDQYKVLKELSETDPELFQSLVFSTNPRGNLNRYTRQQGVAPYRRPERVAIDASDIAEAERASQAARDIGSQFRTLFPAKYAKDAGRAESWLQRNLDIGSVLGGGTGAMETTMRVNPLDIPSAVAEGTLDKLRDYKDSQWFKDLKKDNPKLAKAFETVFKGKE